MKRITKKQIEKFEKVIRVWKAEGAMKRDKQMVLCYKNDRKDLRNIVSLIKRGEYEEAGNVAYWLDTVVRDLIPEEIYDVIMKNV